MPMTTSIMIMKIIIN